MGGFDLNSTFAQEVDSLIRYILQSTDYQILLIPHVLWKGQDDRIISNLIKEKYDSHNRISILDSDNLTYSQIRYVISKCCCFIGARTHAVISAYSTCTPTIAIGYSIKSRGIAKDIGMSEDTVVNSINIKKNQLINAFTDMLQNMSDIKKYLIQNTELYRKKVFRASEIIKKVI